MVATSAEWISAALRPGGPERGPDCETKEYAFLLEGSSKNPDAPQLLNKVYLARVNSTRRLRAYTPAIVYGATCLNIG